MTAAAARGKADGDEREPSLRKDKAFRGGERKKSAAFARDDLTGLALAARLVQGRRDEGENRQNR
jgi:hypothetical protein